MDAALAMQKSRESVVVEGYLVRVPGGCSLMNCFETNPDCNTCEIEIRLSASRVQMAKTLPLDSLRANYRCLTKGDDKCSVDAKGQRVLIRAKLHYSEIELDRVRLRDPQICELPER